MDSPFKTPSKWPVSQILPSSGSSSPFTPKRSRIKKISSEEHNSVSRILAFDESNSRSPTRRKLDFVSFSQQSFLIGENELIQSEQTTPVKIDQSNLEKNNILLSPSIRVHPKRFNISEQDKNIKSSSNKRSGSNNSTPSKKSKMLNASANCKKITSYFQPTQNRTDSIINGFGNNCLKAKHKSNEENMNPTVENCIKSEFGINNTESYKNKIPGQIQPSKKNTSEQSLNHKNDKLKKNVIEGQVTLNNNDNINNIEGHPSKLNGVSSSLPNEKKTSPKRKAVKGPYSNKTTVKELNIAGQVTPSKNGSINNTPLTSPRIMEYLENKVDISGGDTYSRFIKFIVLKAEIFCFGKEDIMKKIEGATHDELKIYGRLISRKHGWIRLSGADGLQKYRELNLCNDFDGVLESLATKQLINTDVIFCELDCLLNILKSQELKELQKTFKIKLSSSKSQTKPEMIKSFINLVKNQRTFCGNSASNLKERVKKIIGYCVKLSDTSRDDIMSCLIYESYPYFIGDEKDRFRDCFNRFSMVEKNLLKFPTFEAKRVSINFSSKDSFEMYKIALNLRHEVQLLLEQKDHENAILVLCIMFENFKSAVCDKSIVESLLKIPTYLRKYSAISVYAHTLFKNITILKKCTSNVDLTKEVLEFLLKHKEFSISKRADLHIELAKVFESQYKQLDLAAKVILDGLKDDSMTELGRQMLSKRALMYANRKIRKLNSELKNELLSVTSEAGKQPPTTTISGQIISVKEKGSSGRKQVYSKKTENGDLHYMSVEELALSHYKSQGFINGLHDEGQLIKSMFLLCFWEIIYGSYTPHVLFISPYQDCPLDWRTRHFYEIREQKIKDRMAELKQMNVDQICDMLKKCCDEYYDTQSVVNWKYMNVDNLDLCHTLLECVGIEVFLAIGDQILKDGRIYLHGMPDLVVWDVSRHKCIFVEVKGPNDKLSERQYSWLLKLMEFGANVEVCHVVGNGGKNT
ncbi:fanconi-associated nuclease 1-like [Myzus persicae]|uniref:fanconi-associated nuclease 1-like n=1 Tax=Myzus persicae TaxID=13164 RepID=UPI000B936F42|nr:fanconi-associated nuclease 1-like [Myzus persicae]